MDKKFLNFADMFDGGGAGATGSEFEGGGILSMIANMLATPLGSKDRQPTAEDRPMMRPQMAPQAAPPPNGLATKPNYADRFELPPQYSGRGNYGMPTQGPNYADRFALPEQPQYSGRGSAGMPYPDWANGDPKMMELVDYLRSRGVDGY